MGLPPPGRWRIVEALLQRLDGNDKILRESLTPTKVSWLGSGESVATRLALVPVTSTDTVTKSPL